MTKKTKVLQTLTLYFMEKGKIMNNREYKAQPDMPIKSSNVIRIIGSWGRIERMIEKNFPIEYDLIVNPINLDTKEVEAVKVETKKVYEPKVKEVKPVKVIPKKWRKDEE